MENFVATSPAHDFFSSNLSSVKPLKVVRVANNVNCSHTSRKNCNGPYNFNLHFNPTAAIIILVLLGFVFSIAFTFIFIWRRSMNGEASRSSRGTGANNNLQGVAIWGLDQTVIDSFPAFRYNLVKGLNAQARGSECAVCLSNFEDEEMVRLLPKCSHAFHPECIDMWLCSHTSCPVCRASLLPAEESNATDTDYGVVEPHTPMEQVTIIIDNRNMGRNIFNEELEQPMEM